MSGTTPRPALPERSGTDQILAEAARELAEAARAQREAAQRQQAAADKSAEVQAAAAAHQAAYQQLMGGPGGLLGGALAGAGGAAGLLGAASGIVGGASPAGQALGGAANVAGAAQAGFAAGGAPGAAAAGALAAVQSVQQAGATEIAYESQLIRLSDPTLNPIQAELERRQLALTRDPRERAIEAAQGLKSPTGGFLGGPFARFFGGAAEDALGPSGQLQLEEDRIAQAPAARALARLQAEAGAIARFGGELSDDMLAIMNRNFLSQEERFQDVQKRIEAQFGTTGDRRGKGE